MAADLIGDFTKEVVIAITVSLLITIIFLSALGEVSGQTELTKSLITALLIIFVISVPIGVISLIKWLGR
jgi:hypothetical protein